MIPDAPFYVVTRFPGTGYHVAVAHTKREACAVHRQAVEIEGARHVIISNKKPIIDSDRIYLRPHNPPPLPRINEDLVTELGLPRPIRKPERY